MSTLITIAEARRRVLAEVRTLEPEPVPVDGALGRVLAASVRSAVDVPPFDSSAMDGFAVADGGEGDLRVVGEARAGSPFGGALSPGTAVRISTGASVPEGTGAVVPAERAELVGEGHGQAVRVARPVPGANVRLAGEDIRAGDSILPAGAELGPAALGVLVSIGRAAADCSRRPRVAILATGDELAEPGHELAPGQIWSSNPRSLAGQVRRAGAAVERTRTLADEAVATREAIADALGVADVVCVSGGVSVGPHDHVKGAFAALGVAESFWGVALRPGKPVWFGTLARDGRSVLAFGLPGNPVSAMVTFHLFVRPALRALQGADPRPARGWAVLDEDLPRNPHRDEAVRCRLRTEPEGARATPTGPQDSHILTSMLAADCLALAPAGEGSLPAGTRLEVELLD